VRILFAFDPWRSAILLTGGDKSGDWQGWYRREIPHAERLYEEYLRTRVVIAAPRPSPLRSLAEAAGVERVFTGDSPRGLSTHDW
jgi:hypothetical protein